MTRRARLAGLRWRRRLDNRLTPFSAASGYTVEWFEQVVPLRQANRADVSSSPNGRNEPADVAHWGAQPRRRAGQDLRQSASAHVAALAALALPLPARFRGCRRIPRRAARGYPWLAPCLWPRALPTQAGAR